MNFQEKLKQIRELAGLDENVKSLLEKMTGKELVSYEGIDALVAALMTFYNGELKKKATTNHTHSKEQIEEFPVFGTGTNEMLEGVKLAETLGIPYGGSLNNSNTKTEGTAYYDSTTKKTYKCTVTNTLNYADASKYEAISNNDLLLKFQNLHKAWKWEYLGRADELIIPAQYQEIKVRHYLNSDGIKYSNGIQTHLLSDGDFECADQGYYLYGIFKYTSSTRKCTQTNRAGWWEVFAR